MSSKKDYNNKCFSPNWLEVDLTEVRRVGNDADVQSFAEKEVKDASGYGVEQFRQSETKEERLESRRRKDLNTLLKELEEIKQNIERVAEKQHRLANLRMFYSGEFAN